MCGVNNDIKQLICIISSSNIPVVREVGLYKWPVNVLGNSRMLFVIVHVLNR